jgi:M6 family metalloprotease-like protein
MKFFATILALPGLALAIPAYPGAWTAEQPDKMSTGATQILVGTASYHFSVMETYNGTYTTIKDHKDDFIKVAVLNKEGRLTPSEHILGKVDEKELPGLGIEMEITEDSNVVAAACNERAYCKWHAQHNGASHSKPPSGNKKNLLIPVIFKNHKGMDLMLDGLEDDMFNDDDISVKDYFSKQSYGKLILTTTFADPVDLSKTETECTGNESGLTTDLHVCLTEALQAIKAKHDIKTYDTISFMHSGRGAEFGNQDIDGAYYDDRVWSHAWEIEGVGRYAIFSAFYGVVNDHGPRLGTLVHEIAQALGIPTMYGDFPGYGLGYFDAMSNPFGFDGTLRNPGSMSAYTKMRAGWAEVVDVTNPGTVTVESSSLSNKIYKISHGYSATEYLLIENRQSEDYDQGMRQGGLVIYHIDETANNIAGHPGQGSLWPTNHYRAAVIQADGRFDIERMESEGDKGDVFHLSGYNGINDFGTLRHGDEVIGEPTTRAYAGGKFVESGVSIDQISESSDSMTFDVNFADDDEEDEA